MATSSNINSGGGASRRPIMRFSQPNQRGPGWEPREQPIGGHPHSNSPQRYHDIDSPASTSMVKGGNTAGGAGGGQGGNEIHHKRKVAKGLAKHVMHDILAFFGEFIGTFMFLFMAFEGAQSASFNKGNGGSTDITTTDNQTILFIALSFGMSLVVVAWAFFRITGAAFNPAVTLSLYLIGNLTFRRAVLVIIAQLLGGIAASGMARVLSIGSFSVGNALITGMSSGQGLVIEMFTTALLCFVVLMLAAEKSKSTFLAPVAIGLALFVGHLASVGWTGAGINPARTLGPSVINASFPSNAWIYYVGQFTGSLIATLLYVALKQLDYEEVVADIDAANPDKSQEVHSAPMMTAFAAMGNAIPGVNITTNKDSSNLDDLEMGSTTSHHEGNSNGDNGLPPVHEKRSDMV